MNGSVTNDPKAMWRDSASLYPRILCAFTLLLTLSTWRLWIGQRLFPQVPLFACALEWPLTLDWIAAAIWSAGLLGGALSGVKLRSGRIAMSAAWIALLGLVTLDQHRLQPWAYFYLLAAPVLVALPWDRAAFWLRALTVSLYFYSALSKLDTRFLQTTGSLFLRTPLELLGIAIAPDVATRLSWILPVGELTVAVALAIRALRHAGVLLAITLHTLLLLILGPWGLGHRWGVLFWNVTSIALVITLFLRRDRSPMVAVDADRQDGASDTAANHTNRLPRIAASSFVRQLAVVPLAIALVMPLTEAWGYWDSWPSWGLYSTRAPKVELLLAPEAVAQLPDNLRVYCQRSQDEAWWFLLRLDLWSLESLEAPIVPSDRFQFAVCRTVLEGLPESSRHFQLLQISAPNRRTGKTTVRRWYDMNGMTEAAHSYLLNCEPRATAAGSKSGR